MDQRVSMFHKYLIEDCYIPLGHGILKLKLSCDYSITITQGWYSMDETARLLGPSKTLEKLIDHTVNDIFNTYSNQFLIEDITYIIPAVWGHVENAELDDIQKVIHKKVSKLVDDSISALSIKNLNDPQAFAIRYLVNRVMIYTITYRVETTKKQISEEKINADNLLMNLSPTGNA